MKKNENLSGGTMMKSTRSENSTMKARTLVGIVVILHMLAVGAFVFIQGCGTVRPRPTLTSVEPPPPPVMPPKSLHGSGKNMSPFKPPVSVESTPSATVRAGSITHVISKGETLSHVAKKYGVSTQELIGINNLANPNILSIGQKLIIPAHGSVMKATSHRKKSKQARASAKPNQGAQKKISVSSGNVYVVQSGDSLSQIAVNYGTTVSALREVNGMSGDRIVVGQKIELPQGARKKKSGSTWLTTSVDRKTPKPEPDMTVTNQSPWLKKPDVQPKESITETVTTTNATDETLGVSDDPNEKPILYTVVQGDTIDEIAKLFIVSRQDIVKLNELDSTAELTPGQKLKIPPSAL